MNLAETYAQIAENTRRLTSSPSVLSFPLRHPHEEVPVENDA